jgi:DNA-binding CsgD family transcriptional regulator
MAEIGASVVMREISLDDYDKLLHAIYRAATQPTLWSDVIEMLSSLLGGTVISLQAHSLQANASLGTVTSETDQSVQSNYEQYYAARNVWMPGLTDIQIGRTVHADEIFDRRDLVRTEFYNDFLRPRGFIGASALILERSEDAVLVLSGTLTDKEMEHVPPVLRKIFDLVGPHISRSFELMRQMPALQLEAQNFHSSEAGKQSAFFLDKRGRVVHLTNAGTGLPFNGENFWLDRHGCLKLFDPKADRSLKAALHQIANADFLHLKGGFAVRRTGKTPLAASVVPLERRTIKTMFDRVFEDVPIALLTLRDPRTPDRSEALREFRLTPAELALTLAIAQGMSLREYAESRTLSVQTVRTQLKTVFAKTDTNRQSQLVALAMSG